MTTKDHIEPLMDFSHLTELVVNKYGKEQLTYIWMEESAELAQALSKMIRYGDDKCKENLIEEIADVCICIDQVMYAYGITDGDIWEMECKKQNRNYERMLNDEA